jgi:regulator of sigma E protease
MTLLAFLLALGVLITVHEWGHYRVAVACGVKVLSFSIGFGLVLLRWRKRHPYASQETEFLVCLIPLGGYVRMLDEADGVVSIADAPMAFNRQPLRKRVAIVAAGPLANLLLAVCLYACTGWLGQHETQPTLATPTTGSMLETAGLQSGDTVLRVGTSIEDLQEVASLERLRWWVLQQDAAPLFLEVQSQHRHSPQVLSLPALNDDFVISKTTNAWQSRGFSDAWSRPVLTQIQHGLAADVAGLLRGDEVQRIDGRVVADAVALRAMVRASGVQHAPSPQIWDVLRPGVGLMRFEVVPDQVTEGERSWGRIGAHVGEAPTQVFVQFGFVQGVIEAVTKTWAVMSMTVQMIWQLLLGHASLDNLSGPLAMADFAGRSASLGLGAYLSYLALVSVSVGIFNLLPIPVLDGGHLLYYLYEACTGSPPSIQWHDALQRVGLAVLVTLMFFSLFNDVVRFGWFS